MTGLNGAALPSGEAKPAWLRQGRENGTILPVFACQMTGTLGPWQALGPPFICPGKAAHGDSRHSLDPPLGGFLVAPHGNGLPACSALET